MGSLQQGVRNRALVVLGRCTMPGTRRMRRSYPRTACGRFDPRQRAVGGVAVVFAAPGKMMGRPMKVFGIAAYGGAHTDGAICRFTVQAESVT
jgi:hypothetical protein